MPPDAPPLTIAPSSESELASVLADANGRGLKVVPRGGGTKSDWGNPPERVDLVISTLGLNRVLEHAAGDMTCTVEAGCTISALQNTLARRGQRLALDPLWPDRATVGGVLATNDGGALRHAFGPARDLLLGVTVALPDGTLARSGGKVVKNVAGYDLPKLMVGAYGTLGVITCATFRLHPRSRVICELSTEAPASEDAARIILALLNSTLPITKLQLRTANGKPFLVHLRLEGSDAAVQDAARRLPVAAELAAGTWDSCDPEHDCDEREHLFQAPGPCDAVAKVTFLPTALAPLCDAVRRCASSQEPWNLIAQGHGVGWIRVRESNEGALVNTLASLRRETESLGGSLSILRAAPSVKRQVVAWADPGGALTLMRRLKEQFDPSRTLNPGRFVGGI